MDLLSELHYIYALASVYIGCFCLIMHVNVDIQSDEELDVMYTVLYFVCRTNNELDEDCRVAGTGACLCVCCSERQLQDM